MSAAQGRDGRKDHQRRTGNDPQGPTGRSGGSYTPTAATPSGLAIRPSVLALVRKRRDALEAAGATPTQAYVIALEERLLDEHDENQRLWDQQPEATVTNLGGEQRLGGGDRDGSAASTGERLAQNLYAAMVDYLRAAGWEREAPGSGSIRASCYRSNPPEISMQTDAPEQVVLPSERQDIDTAATTEGYSLVEAKALHEVGVRNHGWYMTEAEHRGVLDVLERLESALRRIEHWPFDVGHTPERDLREIKEAAHDAVE